MHRPSFPNTLLSLAGVACVTRAPCLLSSLLSKAITRLALLPCQLPLVFYSLRFSVSLNWLWTASRVVDLW